MATQIRLQSPTDEEIMVRCQNETKCGDCQPLQWTNPTNNVRMEPPQDTVAVVVDVRGGRGAVNIVERQDNEYIDKVGVAEDENLVIVPWKREWWYYAIGSVRVAHIERKS